MALGLGLGIQYGNSPLVSLDPATIAFITAAGITDPTQINAVNYLTESLKGINKSENPSGIDFFSGSYAIYPFVGGTATQHRYNLRNVSSFLITYGGGVTHDANGITGNGINAYGDTGFSPLNNNIPLDDAGLAVYTRTSTNVGTELGSGDAGLTNCFLIQTRAGGFANTNINSTTFAAVSEAAGTGLFVAVRRNATSMQLYKNGASILLKTSGAASSARTANNLYLMCNNINGVPISYSGKNIALSIIFEVTNITYVNANMATLYNIIQQYQTLLSRQV
jgi:hypothetical protein